MRSAAEEAEAFSLRVTQRHDAGRMLRFVASSMNMAYKRQRQRNFAISSHK
jgi:hypothetical protein